MGPVAVAPAWWTFAVVCAAVVLACLLIGLRTRKASSALALAVVSFLTGFLAWFVRDDYDSTLDSAIREGCMSPGHLRVVMMLGAGTAIAGIVTSAIIALQPLLCRKRFSAH
jgi:H+/gluconate symporter-like permease